MDATATSGALAGASRGEGGACDVDVKGMLGLYGLMRFVNRHVTISHGLMKIYDAGEAETGETVRDDPCVACQWQS